MANRVGVDMLASNNSSTFSRLYPVSREPTAQLTVQLRHRETPEEYRPPSSNQSCGTLKQQRTAELGNEMRAVQSIYAAHIGDQDLSPTVRDMYHLVTKLALEAVPESDAHLDGSIEKANTVRTIDRFVRETTSDYNTALRELSSRTQDTRLFRFHAHLGDYAGHVCNLLKGDKQSCPRLLLGTWTKIVKALDAHPDRVTSWTARGCPGPEPLCPEMDAIVFRVKEIVDAGTTDLDIDLALFAIRSYARRNVIAHSGLQDRSLSNDSAGLAAYIDNDFKLLEEILPDDEKLMVDKWRRLLLIFRNAHIRQDGGGDGNAKGPLSVAPESSPRLSGRVGRAVLRTQIEMGLKRGSNSPDGPPPRDIMFDPSKFRRRSDPGRRRIPKRPAEEQPPGESSLKRAKGPHYNPSLEAIPEDIEDSDVVLSAVELQLQLHTLAAALAQLKPGDAKLVFQQQIAQLNLQLGKTTAGIEKRKRKMEKKQKKKAYGLLSVSGSSDSNPKTQLTVCDREALDLSNEEVKAVSGFLLVSLSFFFSLEFIYLSIFRDIDPNTDLALTWRSGLCFHKGTTNKFHPMNVVFRAFVRMSNQCLV